MTATSVTGSAVVVVRLVLCAVHQIVTLTGQQSHDETARRIARYGCQHVVIVGSVHHGGRDRVRSSVMVSPVWPKQENNKNGKNVRVFSIK